MRGLTRRVMIEKHFENVFPRFPWTRKGIREANLFFESIGGFPMYYKGLTTPDTKYVVQRANEVWDELYSYTMEELINLSSYY